MINVNDIRVGCWFEHNHGWSYRNEDGKKFYFQWNPADWYALGDCTLFLEDIKPILLSPDILIKAGFVNVRYVHWCVPSEKASNSFEVCLWTDHVSYTKGNNHHVEINYLHQLQNLYFALTQTELNISL